MAASNQHDALPEDSVAYAATSFWTDAEFQSNFGVGRAYKFIVIHHTVGAKAGDLAQLTGPVSVHKYVTKSGERFHLLDDIYGAYGCGTEPANKTGILGDPWTKNENLATLQIEMENLGQEPFTDAQYQVAAEWTANWCKKYGIPVDRKHIVGHKEISRAKVDPNLTWNWDRFLALVNSLVAPQPTAEAPTEPEDLSGTNFKAYEFGPGETQGTNSWVRAKPSLHSDHILTIAAKNTSIKFDGFAEDLEGAKVKGSTRWYHIKPGQTDGKGQALRGWIHSKMIDES
ncbi:MAG: peptidoglycan recognition family protein [Chloroflexota bacterium]|nr:N-acetylmuramoyl-L-alanine amidase [Chloroflexota bacterium]